MIQGESRDSGRGPGLDQRAKDGSLALFLDDSMGRVETVFPYSRLGLMMAVFGKSSLFCGGWGAGKSTATGGPMKMIAWEKLQEK